MLEFAVKQNCEKKQQILIILEIEPERLELM